MVSELQLIIISVFISGLALLGTIYSIYKQYLKGPDIKLIITQEAQPNEYENFDWGHTKIGTNTSGVGLPFDAVFVNEGSRIGTMLPFFSNPLIIKIKPNGIDSNESRYFAPILGVSFQYTPALIFPQTLNVGETLPIKFEFHIGGDAKNIVKVINEYDFFTVHIQYKVTTRKGIEIKNKEIRINVGGAELT